MLPIVILFQKQVRPVDLIFFSYTYYVGLFFSSFVWDMSIGSANVDASSGMHYNFEMGSEVCLLQSKYFTGAYNYRDLYEKGAEQCWRVHVLGAGKLYLSVGGCSIMWNSKG